MQIPRLPLVVFLSISMTAGCLGRAQPRLEPPDASAIAALEASVRELEAENGRQALTLLERRIRIEQLEARREVDRLLLDDMIVEIVRARADEPDGTTAAEAASEIADTEAVVARRAARRPTPDSERALDLLRRAAAELDRGNFGGASYLARVARISGGRVANRASAIENAEGAVSDETAFDAPLPLEVTRHSTMRDGPGTEFRVVKRIEAGTVLTGYAAKGAWVRGRVPDGTSGWVHRSLLEGDSGS